MEEDGPASGPFVTDDDDDGASEFAPDEICEEDDTPGVGEGPASAGPELGALIDELELGDSEDLLMKPPGLLIEALPVEDTACTLVVKLRLCEALFDGVENAGEFATSGDDSGVTLLGCVFVFVEKPPRVLDSAVGVVYVPV
ncbi:hypothetical protein LTR15_001499 [Elasticomyces elasticus]|nr:hypothetical protein LTR15_001499 [Elasticomyces elasticus]